MADWISPVTEAELARLVVVSPHFDDAVMGAGLLLAAHPGATVVTVMGGPPDRYPSPPTEWDARGGFRAGDDIISLRRAEDLAALTKLGAVAQWREFVDHQYFSEGGGPFTPEEVAADLEDVLGALAPTAVLFPFGLVNPDHDLVHRAMRLLLQRLEDISWFCYEDAGYCNLPGMLAWRLASLFSQRTWWPTPAILPTSTDQERKVEALRCYRSQWVPLCEDHRLAERLAAPAPEQFWRLAPPPAGWEAMADVPG